MSLSNMYLRNYLVSSDKALSNVKNEPLILERIETQGHDEARLEELRGFHTAFKDLFEKKERLEGEKKSKTAELHANYKEQRKVLSFLVRMMRLCFKGNEQMLKRLKLDGRQPRNMAGILTYAPVFYKTLLEGDDIREQAPHINISTESMTQYLAAVTHLADIKKLRDELQGELETTTQNRDAAFKILKQGMDQFELVCRETTRDTPQIVEKLGFNVYRHGTGRKRPVKKKSGDTTGDPANEPADDSMIEGTVVEDPPAALPVPAKRSLP